MQVTETMTDGLRREFSVVIPASELDSKVSERLDEDERSGAASMVSGPGKVPACPSAQDVRHAR